MRAKRTYFGYTTAQQRKLLFEVWEATQNITEACRQARVSQRLFYYWKPRFEQDGYGGLETFRSRIAHHLHKKDAALEKEVVELRRKNPDWGKLRIAQELAKANHWEAVVSPNTVRRMLRDAGLWPEQRAGEKTG
jgi:transposase